MKTEFTINEKAKQVNGISMLLKITAIRNSWNLLNRKLTKSTLLIKILDSMENKITPCIEEKELTLHRMHQAVY
jgi:hypothetical protein